MISRVYFVSMLSRLIWVIRLGLNPLINIRTYYIYEKGIKEANNSISLGDEWDCYILSLPIEYDSLLAKGFDFSGYPVREDINAGLTAGASLVCIFKQGKLAHTTWVAKDAEEAIYDSLFNSNLIKKDDFGFIGPCNTYPEYRGRGLYSYALRLACDYLATKKLKGVAINTKAANLVSRRGIEKAGFRLGNKVKFVKVFGMEFKNVSEL